MRPSSLKIETACSFETSVFFYPSTPRKILEDTTVFCFMFCYFFIQVVYSFERVGNCPPEHWLDLEMKFGSEVW